MDESQAYMLLQHHVLVTPDELNHEAFEWLCEALLMGREEYDGPIELRINGNGGYFDETFAMIDLIREDGNVYAYLIGKAYSGHSVLFAGCPQRFASPSAFLGVHPPETGTDGASARSMSRIAARTERSAQKMAETYASACLSGYRPAWWMQKMYDGEASPEFIDADMLFLMGMAKPASQRPFARTTVLTASPEAVAKMVYEGMGALQMNGTLA
jgi:ATP-dependent protease ClpP protease subunit